MPYDEDGRWVEDEDPYKYADYTQDFGNYTQEHQWDPNAQEERVYTNWPNGDPWAPTPSGHETDDAYFLPGPSRVAAPPPAPGPVPGPLPGPDRGGGGGPRPPGPPSGGFRPPIYGAYPGLPGVPDAPTPNLPSWVTPGAYQAPTMAEAENDPGYQFGRQQGEDSLQRWAAARGTLNDSGTAKALLDYGRNAATQQYTTVDARNRDTYKTNYQTQYVDPYLNAYKSALDVWTPKLETWRSGVDMSRLGYTTDTNRIQRDNEMAYRNAWDQYQDVYNRWSHGPLDDQAYGYALAG